MQAARAGFVIGTAVKIRGLKGTPEHNGKQGVVQRFIVEKARFVVKIPGMKKTLAVKPENLTMSGSEPTKDRQGEPEAKPTAVKILKRSQPEAAWSDLERSLLQEVVLFKKPADTASNNEGGEVICCRLVGKDLVSAAAVNQAWRAALHWTTFPECQAWRNVLPHVFTWRLLASTPRSLLEIHDGGMFFDQSVREDAEDDERAIYEEMGVDIEQVFDAETDNQVALTTLSRLCPNISQLNLNGAVHPWTMRCLSRFRGLRALDLNYVKCPWEGAFHVASMGWAKLQSVNFGRYFLDDEVLQSLGMHCPDLRYIVADRCGHAVTDEGIVSLARGCRQLFQVDLSRAQIGDISMRAFAEHCPELRVLELNECRQISDMGLAAFKGCRDPAVEMDEKMAASETVVVATDIHDDRTEIGKVAAPCPELRSMSLMYTGVTEDAVEDFQTWAKDQSNIQHEIAIDFETVDGDWGDDY